MLPDVISERSIKLKKILKEAFDNLSKKNSDVRGFCKQYKFFKEFQDNWNIHFEESINIQDHKGLCNRWHIKLDETEVNNVKELTNKVEEELNNNQAKEEDNKIKWRQQFELDIPLLAKRAREIEDFINDKEFDEFVDESGSLEIVEKIKHYQKQVEEIRKDYQDFDSFKEIVESNKEIPDSIDEACSL